MCIRDRDVKTMHHSMRVNYVGSQPVPDTFKDRADAVVEGKVLADATFEADHLQAKCASKYEAKYGTNAQHPRGVTGADAAPVTPPGCWALVPYLASYLEAHLAWR